MGCRENEESRLSCFDIGNWKNRSDLGIGKLERNVLGRWVKIIFIGTYDILYLRFSLDIQIHSI